MWRRQISLFLIIALFLSLLPAAPMAWAKNEPAVKIIAPKSGFTVKAGSPFDVMVFVKAGLKVSSVTVIGEDGGGLGMTSASPYVVRIDSKDLKPGPLKFRAQVLLEDGTSMESPAVQISISGGSPKGTPAASGNLLKDGTPIILVTTEELVSGRIPVGAPVHYKVDRDVLGPQGQVLIAAGSSASGKVVKSESHGILGKAGKLDIALESARAADGTPVPLRALRTSTGENANDIVIGGALLVSVFFVLFSGHNVEIPPGTIFSAYVNQDTPVARPAPAKVSAAELKAPRSVNITIPAAGSTVQKEDKLIFACQTTPADDGAFVRLYLDDNLVGWQKGNLSRIEWVAEKIKPGEHQIRAEVTFSNGIMINSQPTRFILND